MVLLCLAVSLTCDMTTLIPRSGRCGTPSSAPGAPTWSTPRAELSAAIPLRRYAAPEEFGRVAAFVLSPAASYVSGTMIPVDGGALRAI